MGTVLIATADHNLAATLALELGALGFDTREENTGQDALASVQGAVAVFLDVNLPVFDGLEVASLLREDPDVPRELPIVLITGNDTNSRDMHAAGISLQLSKTHAVQELRELMGRALFGA